VEAVTSSQTLTTYKATRRNNKEIRQFELQLLALSLINGFFNRAPLKAFPTSSQFVTEFRLNGYSSGPT
jgi:hypothetical protein